MSKIKRVRFLDYPLDFDFRMFLFWRAKLDLKYFNLIKLAMSSSRGSRKRSAKEASGENEAPESKKLLNSVESDLSDVKDIKEKFNLKIVSFNVAGLRACVKKNCMEYLEREDADIICLNVRIN